MIFPFTSKLKQQTDGELMQQVVRGEHKAFDELYRRYARRLQGFFFRMLGGDAELAADFTQDLFVRIWTSRSSYKGGDQADAWLFTMAYNLCRNEYRHREVEDQYVWQQEGKEEAVDNQIEIHLDAQAFDRALAKVLKAMPPEPRMLFALRFEEELPLGEIAEILHLPLGTVKSRCHYLVAQIKQKLHHYENVR